MSSEMGTKDEINFSGDNGLFGTILVTWGQHMNLRTCPEDWWLTVITRLATSVDNYANHESLRNFFVGGREGKETIVVDVPSFSIYDTDYTFLFNSFSEKINQRIEVPGYVQTVTSDFSTTTPDQLIGSQITVMKSFQKYFDYEMGICGCGISGLEMSGTEQDWRHLKNKLQDLRKILTPIQNTLQLNDYFNFSEMVFDNLLNTYLGKNMSKWWSKILIDSKVIEYGPSGMSQYEVEAYNGWIVHFCNGVDRPLKAKDLMNGKYKELSGLTSCPMKIVDRLRNVEDNSTLVAGILGYRIDEKTPNGVGSIQPVHGWSLLLPNNSPLIIR